MIPDSITEIGEDAFFNCRSLDESAIEKIQSINTEGFKIFDMPDDAPN